jgi:hypothetical protein
MVFRVSQPSLTDCGEGVTKAKVRRLNLARLDCGELANARHESLAERKLDHGQHRQRKTKQDHSVSHHTTNGGLCFHGLTLFLHLERVLIERIACSSM